MKTTLLFSILIFLCFVSKAQKIVKIPTKNGVGFSYPYCIIKSDTVINMIKKLKDEIIYYNYKINQNKNNTERFNYYNEQKAYSSGQLHVYLEIRSNQ